MIKGTCSCGGHNSIPNTHLVVHTVTPVLGWGWGSDTLFGPLEVPGMHVTHVEKTLIHIKLSFKNKILKHFRRRLEY